MMNGNHLSTSSTFPIDRLLHAWEGHLTSGVSPASALLAYLDWAVHLLNSPGKRAELFEKALRMAVMFSIHAWRIAARVDEDPIIEPASDDRRFADEAWRQLPFSLYYQAFLLAEQWWHAATIGMPGVSPHHRNEVCFAARQYLDVYSPSNFPATNPEILRATFEQRGMNLVRGFQWFLEDWQRALLQREPAGTESFRVGRNVAVTPGKVVYRNRLIELIQYAPATKTVYGEPVLIVPAWIMKYYILDLSPDNSLVRYLVAQGHTVFIVSWKNPTEQDGDLGMNDYRKLGIINALKVIRVTIPDRRVHAVGYCLGGTLLAIAAAALARDGKDVLKTMTLFAAQTDFVEAGELMLFIDQSQVAYLEDMMWNQGYLDTKQMVGAFQLLRSKDLIWSRIVHEYLMGERRPMTDLMAWNADATRMPYSMHSEYLRKIFLNNELAEGHYRVNETPVALADIGIPLFVVGAEKDHVAPWKSVYKIKLLTDTDVTFLLTSGGHNAGIISEPGHSHRHYRISTKYKGEKYLAPDDWYARFAPRAGSWWPVWEAWLAERSGEQVGPPPLGAAEAGYPPLCGAPGRYVLRD